MHNLFPLKMQGDNLPPPLQTILDAVNNLNERIAALESRPAAAPAPTNDGLFTAADRSVLNEVSAFLGVHTVVANTLATREDDSGAVINPNTGLEMNTTSQRQAVTRPADLPGPGA